MTTAQAAVVNTMTADEFKNAYVATSADELFQKHFKTYGLPSAIIAKILWDSIDAYTEKFIEWYTRPDGYWSGYTYDHSQVDKRLVALGYCVLKPNRNQTRWENGCYQFQDNARRYVRELRAHSGGILSGNFPLPVQLRLNNNTGSFYFVCDITQVHNNGRHFRDPVHVSMDYPDAWNAMQDTIRSGKEAAAQEFPFLRAWLQGMPT